MSDAMRARSALWFVLFPLLMILAFGGAACGSGDDDDDVARSGDDDDDNGPPAGLTDDDDDDDVDDDTTDDDTADDDTVDDDTTDDDTADDDTGDDDTGTTTTTTISSSTTTTVISTTTTTTGGGSTTTTSPGTTTTTSPGTTTTTGPGTTTTTSPGTTTTTSPGTTTTTGAGTTTTTSPGTTTTTSPGTTTTTSPGTTTTTSPGTTTTTVIGTTTTTTTIPSPTVVITAPTQNEDLTSYDVEVAATLTNATTVTVYVDDVDVTSEFEAKDLAADVALTITPSSVSGSITLEAGEHTLRITVQNATGNAQASVDFNVDLGGIIIYEPEPGTIFNVRDVPVSADYINIATNTVHVLLNGEDKTGDLTVFNGEISGELPFLEEGDYTLEINGFNANNIDPDNNPDGIVRAYSFFTVEVVPAHFDIKAKPRIADTGEEIEVEFTLIDESGNDRTGDTVVSWSTDPSSPSAVINDGSNGSGSVIFNEPGFFNIVLETVLDSQPVTGEAFIWVRKQDAASVELELSDNDIDAGTTIEATATAYNSSDEPIYADFKYSVWPPGGVTVVEFDNMAQITFERAGEFRVRVKVIGSSTTDEQTVIVHAGPPVDIEVIIPDPVLEEGEYTTPYAVLIDAQGNQVDEVGAVFGVAPSTGVVPDSPEEGDYTFNTAGHFVVTANAEPPYNGLNDSASLDVIDVSPPKIVIYTERGQWVEGNNLVVEGEVTDCDYIHDTIKYIQDGNETQGQLSGQPTPCRFSHSAELSTGLNIVEVVATDEADNEAEASISAMHGDKVEDGDLVPNGLWLRLNESTFDQIAGLIEPTLNEGVDQLPDLIYAQNPVFDDSIDVWGVEVASAKGTVTNASFGDAYFTIDAQEFEGLTIDVGVEDVNIDMNIRGAVAGIGYNTNGDIDADKVGLRATAQIFVDEYDDVTITLSSVDAYLDGFSFDISDFPDELEDLFIGAMTDFLESAVENTLSAIVPEVLEALLGQLPTDFAFNLSGYEVNVEYAFNQILWDDDGGTFKMDMGMWTTDGSPAVPDFGGSLETESIPPQDSEFSRYIPGTQNPYAFGIVLTDEVLNQSLYTLYRTGLLSLDFNGIFTTDTTGMGLIFPGLKSYCNGCDINMKLRPLLPPLLTVGGTGNGDPSLIPVEVQMGELMVSLYVDNGSTEELFLDIAGQLIMPAGMGIKYPDNTLDIQFADDEATMAVYVLAEPLGFGWDNQKLQGLSSFLLQLVAPSMDALFEGIVLPGFGGVNMSVLNQQIMGANNDYMGFFSDLEIDKGAVLLDPPLHPAADE
ncbi:MAG: hypothetical protein H6684_15405 [Deltaproteobacteria bacterium]|nr:hypothetical protein [Deltaproteobacteria bacterium]